MRETGGLRSALHQLDVRLTRLEPLPQSVSAHIKALTDQLARVTSDATTFQDSASAHLKALTDHLARVASDANTLSQRLYAAPFTDPTDRFTLTNGDGKRVLGFRSPREQHGDVYRGFEDVFRGSEGFIRGRLQTYLPLLIRHERIIEIGCGRGELLDLLRDAGVAAVGVDTDASMVQRCRDKGFHVEHMGGLRFLGTQADASVPAIFAAQVVEHLSYEDLIGFLRLARAKLKSGGQLIFETVNPHALEAFKTFWTDLTHQKPIFPEVALAWCWLLGFEQAYVIFPGGENDFERDRKIRGEYAVVATNGSQDQVQ
jgi:SAM-dependent methyltransferase